MKTIKLISILFIMFLTLGTRSEAQTMRKKDFSGFDLKASKFSVNGDIDNPQTVIQYDKNGTTKFKVDSAGHVFQNVSYLYDYVTDSSIVKTLVQNEWIHATNSAKNMYSGFEGVGCTIVGDTIVNQCGGIFLVKFELNIAGVDSKTYEYRILQKNSTNHVVSDNIYVSAGATVVRREEALVNVQPNSRIWLEMRCTSASPGTVTIYGAKLLSYQIKLEE